MKKRLPSFHALHIPDANTNFPKASQAGFLCCGKCAVANPPLLQQNASAKVFKPKNNYLHLMPIKRKIPYDSGHYFITFTCFNWLSLIDISNSYDLVYKWFDVLKEKGHYITGYIIMPNHVHVTIAFRKTRKNINTVIGDGKRFTGYEIINRLKKKR